MVRRKLRIPLVADTNVFVRNFKARSNTNPNRRIIRLVSAELIAEYLEVFATVLGMDAETVQAWRMRLEEDRRYTVVHLARRYTESRDPDDNLLLATAVAGGADYLVTNDRDLLDLPSEFVRTLPFRVVSPREFLKDLEKEK